MSAEILPPGNSGNQAKTLTSFTFFTGHDPTVCVRVCLWMILSSVGSRNGFRCFSFPKTLIYSRCPTQQPRLPQRCMFLFRRGAEFGSDLYTTNRTSGSKVQLDLQTQTPQIDSDQLPKHRGMLGSTKRGGGFQQHQTYRQSTSRSKNSPKTNRWRHPVSGLQKPIFSQMNIEM